MPTGAQRLWLDKQGKPFFGPATARTASDGERTHLLFAPHDHQSIHPLTLCGVVADVIPGDGRVSCFECRMAEH